MPSMSGKSVRWLLPIPHAGMRRAATFVSFRSPARHWPTRSITSSPATQESLVGEVIRFAQAGHQGRAVDLVGSPPAGRPPGRQRPGEHIADELGEHGQSSLSNRTFELAPGPNRRFEIIDAMADQMCRGVVDRHRHGTARLSSKDSWASARSIPRRPAIHRTLPAASQPSEAKPARSSSRAERALSTLQVAQTRYTSGSASSAASNMSSASAISPLPHHRRPRQYPTSTECGTGRRQLANPMTSPLCRSSITHVRSSPPTLSFSVITRRVAATSGCGAHIRYLVTSGSRATLWKSAPASFRTGKRSTSRGPVMRSGGWSTMVLGGR